MRPFLTTLALAVLFCTSPRTTAGDVPRYKLPVGRVLSYSMESQSKDAKGKRGHDTAGTLKLTVIGQNADGSSRIVAE